MGGRMGASPAERKGEEIMGTMLVTSSSGTATFEDSTKPHYVRNNGPIKVGYTTSGGVTGTIFPLSANRFSADVSSLTVSTAAGETNIFWREADDSPGKVGTFEIDETLEFRILTGMRIKIGTAELLHIDDAAITTTAASDANGKDVYLGGPAGGTDASKDGGTTGGGMVLTAGAGGAAGATSSVTGTETGGVGGAIQVTAGAGGAAGTATGGNVGGVGGAFTLVAGAGGGASTNAQTGGVGGAMSLAAGAGAASGTASGGAGGALALAGGAGGGGTAVTSPAGGGNITLAGGAGGTATGSTGVAGRVILRNALPLLYQAAPETATATANLTDAQMLSGILVATPTAAAAYTVRTGTQIEAALPAGLATNDCFDLTIINLGGSGDDITFTNNTGVTIVGDPVIGPIADVATEQMSSGTFRLRRSAANTFIAYRIA